MILFGETGAFSLNDPNVDGINDRFVLSVPSASMQSGPGCRDHTGDGGRIRSANDQITGLGPLSDHTSGILSAH